MSSILSFHNCKDDESQLLNFLSPILMNIHACFFVCQLSVKGYNDKQHILLKKIIEKMATFEIDEKRFDIIKEAVRHAYTNAHTP